jgi:hypothetical protein
MARRERNCEVHVDLAVVKSHHASQNASAKSHHKLQDHSSERRKCACVVACMCEYVHDAGHKVCAGHVCCDRVHASDHTRWCGGRIRVARMQPEFDQNATIIAQDSINNVARMQPCTQNLMSHTLLIAAAAGGMWSQSEAPWSPWTCTSS